MRNPATKSADASVLRTGIDWGCCARAASGRALWGQAPWR